VRDSGIFLLASIAKPIVTATALRLIVVEQFRIDIRNAADGA
jgi:hypothetical protein